MNKIYIIFFIFISIFSNLSFASSQESSLATNYKFVNDINNKSSLQRGAKYFVNYCMGCHSLKYMRFSSLAKDIEVEEEIFFKNLVFTNKKIGETMTISMRPSDAELWFGAVPPDLSLVARSKGTDWIYLYLNTFYEDDDTLSGFNNLAYPNTAMPHILADLQGSQKLVLDSNNKPVSIQKVLDGEYSEIEYQQMTSDITNFLAYVSEPAKLKRHSMGFWVLMFIFIFTIIAYYTKKEFWKEIK
tara:strand:- start:427 stop:1158 length:732 start_codon:yes stop_codon:yes gene_type:complete